MPNEGMKISQLPAATEVLDSDVVAGVGGGVTRKFTFATIANWLRTKLQLDSIGGFGQATEIAANSDLNDFTTPGVYYCPNSTVAATLRNSPIATSGFEMTVSASSASGNAIQMIYNSVSTLSRLYIRRYYGSAWYPWLSPARITSATETGLNGVLAGDGSVIAVKPVDPTPTAGSPNLVTSGGVKSAISFAPDTGNAGFHNSIYRGKSLGSSVTAEQQAAISSGTFDDLYIGDYWTINGVNWRIADFDYWRGASYTSYVRPHHVVIVPDSPLVTSPMNSTRTTAGGYLGSDFWTGSNGNTAKADITFTIESAFGASHILSYYGYFTNAVTDGVASNTTSDWHTIELMNETMVLGVHVHGSAPYEIRSDWGQLSLFRLDRSRASFLTRSCWLRNIATSESFALINYNANSTIDGANASNRGIRPAFAIQYG